MIFVCSNCEAKFDLDEGAFEEGTTLTCATCSQPITPTAARADLGIDDIDFRKVGITWKVRVGLGLVFEYPDYSTLSRALREGKISDDDLLSHDGKQWTTLGEIRDLRQHFMGVYNQAQARGNPRAAPAPSSSLMSVGLLDKAFEARRFDAREDDPTVLTRGVEMVEEEDDDEPLPESRPAWAPEQPPKEERPRAAAPTITERKANPPPPAATSPSEALAVPQEEPPSEHERQKPRRPEPQGNKTMLVAVVVLVVVVVAIVGAWLAMT